MSKNGKCKGKTPLNKQLFAVALLGVIMSSTLICFEKQDPLPEHVRKCLNVRAQHSYNCRDLTPEEAAQANKRGEGEKIAMVRKIAERRARKGSHALKK